MYHIANTPCKNVNKYCEIATDNMINDISGFSLLQHNAVQVMNSKKDIYEM